MISTPLPSPSPAKTPATLAVKTSAPAFPVWVWVWVLAWACRATIIHWAAVASPHGAAWGARIPPPVSPPTTPHRCLCGNALACGTALAAATVCLLLLRNCPARATAPAPTPWRPQTSSLRRMCPLSPPQHSCKAQIRTRTRSRSRTRRQPNSRVDPGRPPRMRLRRGRTRTPRLPRALCPLLARWKTSPTLTVAVVAALRSHATPCKAWARLLSWDASLAVRWRSLCSRAPLLPALLLRLAAVAACVRATR